MFQLDRAKQTILIEGITYFQNEIVQLFHTHQEDKSFQGNVFHFLMEWFNDAMTIDVHTSGSTGEPKLLKIEKHRMMESACLTCSFLKLKTKDTALLCMPLKYIGGMMMIVRALVAGLNLIPVTPSSRPLQHIKKAPTFAAMTPMQVSTALEYKEESICLKKIKHLIIGGGAIDPSLENILSDFPYAVWSTYAMTETLSHIALRRLNGKKASAWYIPFKNIQVSLSPEQTLIINAPQLCHETLVTNDIVEFNNHGHFRVLGRKDNTINSGGIKIQIEKLENIFNAYIQQPFLITSIPDKKLGECVILLVEKMPSISSLRRCKEKIPPYWYPKHIIQVTHIPLTETGKPKRAQAKELAQCYLHTSKDPNS